MPQWDPALIGAAASWSAEADSALDSVVRRGQSVAILDYPYHDNFGDAAIWCGERVWLDRAGIRRRYSADIGRYSVRDLELIHPEGPIFLHGGGNFGDYWPEHQDHREQVARDFPDRLIVQLPQAVGFQDSSAMNRIAAAMSAHENFLLMVRDERSLQLGLEMGLRTTLVPDAALNLGPLSRRGAPTKDILVLARTDHESSGLRDFVRSRPAADLSLEDWWLPASRRRLWTGLKVAPRLTRRLRLGSRERASAMAHLTPIYDRMAELMVRAAVTQLSSARVVVSDRLHAHVIASLLGIPNVVVDNNYGKVAGVFEAHTHASPDAVMATSPAEALQLARDLLS